MEELLTVSTDAGWAVSLPGGAGGIEVVGKIKGSNGLPLIISVLEYATAASERRRGCARSR